MPLDLNAQAGRVFGTRDSTGGFRDDFNGMHPLGLDPSDPPDTRVPGLLYRRDVTNAPVPTVISDMGCTTARIPIQKEAWPTMMMHRYRLAGGRHADFKNPNELVFKNDFMSGRSGLD